KALVLGLIYSYGVWIEALSQVDLKTRKSTALELPKGTGFGGLRAGTLLAGANGEVCLANQQGAWRYSAEGKLLGAVYEQEEQCMVGVWGGETLTVYKGKLVFQPMPATAKKSN